MSSIINTLLGIPSNLKNTFTWDVAKMNLVIEKNRQTSSAVDDWIDETAFSTSCFNYGVPDFIKTDINLPLNKSVTYSDLMVYLIDNYLKKVNYLEIGVSVGKNFFQIINADRVGSFTAYDIEEINPVLEKKLDFISVNNWRTPPTSIKKTSSSLKEYLYNGNSVNYICADVWDEKSWAVLKGKKFNLVFSDALHSAKAILFEFEMLVKYDLLDKNFIIVWDDLIGKMKRSFFKIIKKYDRQYNIQEVYLLSINGWIGQHEKPHSVGLISNFSISTV